MTNVRMKAIDTLHVSSVKADNLQPGEEFDTPQYVADDLEKRGLATRVQSAEKVEEEAPAPEPEAKQEPAAPENRALAAPANKTKPAAKSK